MKKLFENINGNVFKLIQEDTTKLMGQTANIDIIKAALQRVQFDKSTAINLLLTKARENGGIKKQELNRAAEYLEKMSMDDIKSLYSRVSEESEPEPYDDETDSFQPSPRERTHPSTPSDVNDENFREKLFDELGKQEFKSPGAFSPQSNTLEYYVYNFATVSVSIDYRDNKVIVEKYYDNENLSDNNFHKEFEIPSSPTKSFLDKIVKLAVVLKKAINHDESIFGGIDDI